jgi:hypothetical protein
MAEDLSVEPRDQAWMSDFIVEVRRIGGTVSFRARCVSQKLTSVTTRRAS